MPRDSLDNLQDELRQFVLHTRKRLNGLTNSLNELRSIVQQATRRSDTLADGPRLDRQDYDPTAEPCPPQLTASHDMPDQPNDAMPTHIERTEVDDRSDASQRLEAIKQRLAIQIENA